MLHFFFGIFGEEPFFTGMVLMGLLAMIYAIKYYELKRKIAKTSKNTNL